MLIDYRCPSTLLNPLIWRYRDHMDPGSIDSTAIDMIELESGVVYLTSRQHYPQKILSCLQENNNESARKYIRITMYHI